jgi:hypothetical protein
MIGFTSTLEITPRRRETVDTMRLGIRLRHNYSQLSDAGGVAAAERTLRFLEFGLLGTELVDHLITHNIVSVVLNLRSIGSRAPWICK